MPFALLYGAADGNRTRMVLPPRDFKSYFWKGKQG